MLMTILPFAIFSIIASPNQGGAKDPKNDVVGKNFQAYQRVPSLLSKNGYIRAKNITF